MVDLSKIIDNSPYVVIKWFNSLNNIEYISKNITKWGYDINDDNLGNFLLENIKSYDREKIIEKIDKFESYKKEYIKIFFKFKNITTNCFMCIEGRLWCEKTIDNNRYINGIFHDITPYKEMEEKNIKNEIKYEMIYKNSPAGIIFVSNTGDVIDANPAMLKILGSPSIEATKKINLFNFPPLVKAGISDAIKKCFIDGENGVFEHSYKTKWNKDIFLRYSLAALKDKNGNITAVEGIVDDITKRKLIEKELKENEERYRVIVENTHEAIYIEDNNHFIFFNQKMEEITGYTIEELYGKSIYNIIADEDIEILKNYINNRLNGVVKNSCEIKIITKSKKRSYCEFFISNITIDGNIVKLGMLLDITKKKIAENGLKERLKYEQAIAKYSKIVLKSDRNSTYHAMKIILSVSNSDRAYIYKNVKESNLTFMEPLYEVCREGVRKRGEKIPYFDTFKKWFKTLSTNSYVSENIDHFWNSEKEYLSQYGVKSVLIIPIWIDDKWYGFIGFDDIKTKREWSSSDITLLRTASEIVATDIVRVMAEDKLTESRNYLDKIINSIPDPLFIKNENHQYILLNKAFCKLMNRSPEELLGKTDFEYIDKGKADKFYQYEKEIFEKGGKKITEDMIESDNGDQYWMLTKRSFYINNRGESSLIGLMRDITDRKDIEEKLSQSEQLLKNITSSAYDAIILAQSNGTIIYSNKATKHIFDYEPDEIIGKTIEILIPHRWRKLFNKKFNNIKNRVDIPQSTIAALAIKKGGDEFPIEISWSRLTTNNQEHFLGLVRDITENEKLKKQLEKELNKFKKLLEFDSFLLSITDLSFIIDTVLVTITAGSGFQFNRAFILLIENESGFLKGRSAIGPSDAGEAGRIYHNIEAQNLTLADLIKNHHENRDVYDQAVKNLVQKIYVNPKEDQFFNQLFQLQTIIQTKKDNLYPDRYIIDLLNNDDLIFLPLVINDNPVGVIMMDNYITYRDIMDDELELLQLYANRVASAIHRAKLHDALNKEIEKTKFANIQITQINNRLIQTEKMAAMGEITSEIAHEIRNPLVSIGGFARALTRDLNRSSKEYDLLNIIIDEGQRLENILNNVLSYARGNRINIEKKSILEAINQAIKLLEYYRQDKNLDIVISSGESGKLEINYDYEKFIQVFFNLIKNAMQASDKDTQIEIIIERIQNKMIIRIKDYGEGIREDYLDSIFNPFFTTKSQGIGLGLSIVKQIINNHGGDINFITEENKGTEFIITLNI